MSLEVTIIGAGLTGLSSGFHLKQEGVDYHIYEKDASIGGLCRSIREGGFTFDYTGHLLHDPQCPGLNFPCSNRPI